jgi:hypothetical protein
MSEAEETNTSISETEEAIENQSIENQAIENQLEATAQIEALPEEELPAEAVESFAEPRRISAVVPVEQVSLTQFVDADFSMFGQETRSDAERESIGSQAKDEWAPAVTPLAPSVPAATINQSILDEDDSQLPADHPLMERVQKAIFSQLSAQESKLELELRERVSFIDNRKKSLENRSRLEKIRELNYIISSNNLRKCRQC